MDIAERVIQGAKLLELRGNLDFSSRENFMNAVQQASQNSSPHVMIDLQGITWSDDSAISLLVIAHQKIVHHHGRLSLINPSEHIAVKLHSVKFPRIIPIFASVEDALKRKTFPSHPVPH